MAIIVESVVGADLDDALRPGRLTSVFQPVVSLADRQVVGFEALSRGPAGSALESPVVLLDRAAELGRVAETDLACRRAALQAAVDGGLAGPAVLFLNAEPEGIGGDPAEGLHDLLATLAGRGVRLVLELTERALTVHPAELLVATDRARELGWWVALDDIGAEQDSLALLPFLAPDVIKLDMSLVQRSTTENIADIVNAVLAHQERTGAVILAEGIETETQLALALSMGATLGQGWLFGRPAPLRAESVAGELTLPDIAPAGPPAATPWDALAAAGPSRAATKPLLVALSLTLERQARASGSSAVLLGTFQRDRYLTPAARRRFRTLARTAAFVAVFGTDVSPDGIEGVRNVPTAIGSPLAAEWDVIVVAPHFSAALVSLDRGNAADEADRVFDYAVSYDRDVVLAAARSLLARIPRDPAVAADQDQK